MNKPKLYIPFEFIIALVFLLISTYTSTSEIFIGEEKKHLNLIIGIVFLVLGAQELIFYKCTSQKNYLRKLIVGVSKRGHFDKNNTAENRLYISILVIGVVIVLATLLALFGLREFF